MWWISLRQSGLFGTDTDNELDDWMIKIKCIKCNSVAPKIMSSELIIDFIAFPTQDPSLIGQLLWDSKNLKELATVYVLLMLKFAFNIEQGISF